MAKGDLYLKVTGKLSGAFKGEASDESHKGEIELEGWSWGMDAPTDGRSGLRTGRMTMGGVLVTKRVDGSSTALMGAMSHNEALTATLYVRKTGGKKAIDYLTLKLTNAMISSYEVAWQETPVPAAIEHLTLRFQKIEVTYAGQDATGMATGSTIFTGDVAPGGV